MVLLVVVGYIARSSQYRGGGRGAGWEKARARFQGGRLRRGYKYPGSAYSIGGGGSPAKQPMICTLVCLVGSQKGPVWAVLNIMPTLDSDELVGDADTETDILLVLTTASQSPLLNSD